MMQNSDFIMESPSLPSGHYETDPARKKSARPSPEYCCFHSLKLCRLVPCLRHPQNLLFRMSSLFLPDFFPSLSRRLRRPPSLNLQSEGRSSFGSLSDSRASRTESVIRQPTSIHRKSIRQNYQSEIYSASKRCPSGRLAPVDESIRPRFPSDRRFRCQNSPTKPTRRKSGQRDKLRISTSCLASHGFPSKPSDLQAIRLIDPFPYSPRLRRGSSARHRSVSEGPSQFLHSPAARSVRPRHNF
jgi:hypothetical protein